MSKTIFFLVKVFDKKEYAEQFMKGSLFANRVSYFRDLEEGEASNRADKNEGVVSWHQSDQITVTINGRTLTDLSGPVSTKLNYHGYLNVFCVFAAHSGGFKNITKENLSSFKQQLELPNDCQKLGSYAVVVTNFTEFQKRVVSAARDNNFGINAGLVEYYNPVTFSGEFSEELAIFRKRDEFSHQSEYRISIDTGADGNDPIFLELGDISDITTTCKTEEINKLLSIQINKPVCA